MPVVAAAIGPNGILSLASAGLATPIHFARLSRIALLGTLFCAEPIDPANSAGAMLNIAGYWIDPRHGRTPSCPVARRPSGAMPECDGTARRRP